MHAGVHGFWYPYRNVFKLVEEELRIQPFTDWCPSAQYSPNGLEVTSPIFQVTNVGRWSLGDGDRSRAGDTINTHRTD